MDRKRREISRQVYRCCNRAVWGLLIGLTLLMGCCGCNKDSEPSSVTKMSAELREEADAMMVKYKKGDILNVFKVPILGEVRDVPIVESYRNADYGFLKLPNDGGVYAQEVGKYYIYTYDKNYLLVVLKERYVNAIKRSSDNSP